MRLTRSPQSVAAVQARRNISTAPRPRWVLRRIRICPRVRHLSRGRVSNISASHDVTLFHRGASFLPLSGGPARSDHRHRTPLDLAKHCLGRGTPRRRKVGYDEAKGLGTVEAWDAFLSHYPTGFHANLARANVKKLAEDPRTPSPPAGPTVSANDDFPVAAGSWGGVLRDGPGQQFRRSAACKRASPSP